MADQQAILLQLVQFVGLIAPAVAILMELLVRLYGGLGTLTEDKEIPVELQILFAGFSAVLMGGVIVGFQLLTTIEDPITRSATFLIFGGLPLLSVAVILVNVKIRNPVPDGGIKEQVAVSIVLLASAILPLILSILIFLGPIYRFKETIQTSLAWWVFAGPINTTWYFYFLAVVLVYKLIYELWRRDTIPSSDIRDVLSDWATTTFVLGTLYSIFVLPIFGIYFLLVHFSVPFFSTKSLLSSIPFVWGGLMLFVVVSIDIDPNSDDSS